MVTAITYPASNFVIKIRGYSDALSPVPTTETEILNTLNMDESVADAIRSNSQGELKFVHNLGSLTSITLRIYYYNKHEVAKDGFGNYISYVQTASSFSAGTETLRVDEITLDTNPPSGVGFRYAFFLGGSDAIRITIKGNGADNTGSYFRNAFVALRVN
jgi:hypothetical protein